MNTIKKLLDFSKPVEVTGDVTLSFAKIVPSKADVLSPTAATSVSYFLHVNVSRCTNLASADTLGLSDAFVILRLNNTQFARTDVIRDSLNPVFENESFEIPILCGLSSPTLTCEVWDMDNLSVGDFLGNCTINVANLSLAPFSDDDIQLMEVTTPLKNCGKVSIPKRFPSNVDSMHKCPSV
ncbi:hypothetical protein ScalyP_jg686 [Parmales sp. scaly parma]|nr:hypothetical protein ScalyP_jg686 [Parmales sp. scaly parma]